MGSDASSDELFDLLAYNLQSATEVLQQLRETPVLPQWPIEHKSACSAQEATEGLKTTTTWSGCEATLHLPSQLPDRVTPSSNKWEIHPGWDENLEEAEAIAITPRRFSLRNSSYSVLVSPRWHAWSFSPTSAFRQWWEFASLFVLFFDIFIAPLETFFATASSTGIFTAFLITSISYWTINIPLRFFFAFYDYAGVPERRLKVIMVRYMHTWFVFDLVMVSLDWCLLGLSSSALHISHIRMLRLVRVLRMSRKFAWMGEARINFEANFFNNVALLGLLVAYLHLNACAWFSLSDWTDSPAQIDMQHESAVYRYFTSLNFAMAHFRTTNLPSHESMAMRLYIVIVSLIALIASPLLVGKITTSLVRMESSRKQGLASREQLRLYLRENAVPNKLNQRIWCVLQNIPASKPLTFSTVALLQMLPAGLADDLRLEVLRPLLSLHPFFCALLQNKSMSQTFSCAVVRQCLEESCLSLGTCIFAAGEQAHRRMLIIKNGQLDYIDMRVSISDGSRRSHLNGNQRELATVNDSTAVCAKMQEAPELVPKDRVWLGGSYRATLNAPDIITWLVKSGRCKDRKEAVEVGLELQKHGLITHVWGMPLWMFPFMDTEMYFRYTERALMLKGSEVLLGPGNWLCEQALWLSCWRHCGTATVTSQTYCEILVVDAENLQNVIAWMPDVQAYARLFVKEGYSSEVGFKADCEILLQRLTNENMFYMQPRDNDGNDAPDPDFGESIPSSLCTL